MKAGLLVVVICMSPICFGKDFYKCIDAQGKPIFSDKQCPKSTSQSKISYKETSFEDQLIGAVPGKSKIVGISANGDETYVDFQFTTPAELQEFIRLSARLSSKNVNLLKVVMPLGESKGHAKLQITSKDNGLFKKTSNK